MIRSKYAHQFRFSIEELHTEKESFTILHPYDKTAYDIVEEAARLFYYGKSGWKEGWPLTFVIETMSGIVVARAHVFIMSSVPHFEVILCETPRSPSDKPTPAPPLCDETSSTPFLGRFWAMIRAYLVRRPL